MSCNTKLRIVILSFEFQEMTIQIDIDEKAHNDSFYQWLKTSQKLNNRANKMTCVMDHIQVSLRQYALHYTLVGKLEIDSDGMFVLDNEDFEIFAVGETLEKAIQDFNEQFDFSYQLFSQKSDSELSSHLIIIKKKYLEIVKQVK